ncbi:MAG: hypothetical protein MJZ19_11705 [Paludibacteraceae bacterium]|nr:hypothetical protein [Paludibacteraceae bacterium]
MKKLIYLFFALLVSVFSFSGCSDDEKENGKDNQSVISVDGVWQSTEIDDFVIIFDNGYLYNAEGDNGEWYLYRCKYTFSDGKLWNINDGIEKACSVTISDNKLVLIDLAGSAMFFERSAMPNKVKVLKDSGVFEEVEHGLF